MRMFPWNTHRRRIVAADYWFFNPTTCAMVAARGGAAGMRVGIVVLAAIALCGDATAAPAQYVVDGLTLGTQLNFDSASYKQYKCSPSEQFVGLTWCQKVRNDKERRGAYSAAFSLLHARDGSIVYVNRSQEPAFFSSTEADEDIQRYARKIGEPPRIIKMPHRSGLPDGLIAIWGQTTLVQLDAESVKLLSDGKSPKKGLLIDFLGNFTRSAKEGLPIYRIDGGPGFVWAASFNQKGRGTLRFAAVDASGFVAPPAPEPQAKSEGDRNETASIGFESRQTIEQLKTELAAAGAAIADLKKAKAAAEDARIEAAKARLDAETARSEIEHVRATEKARLENTIERLEADRAGAHAKSNKWEDALYGSIGGLLVVLTVSAVYFVVKRQKAWTSAADPIDVSGPSQDSDADIEPYASSPAIAIAEDAFGRELEEQVAAINATQGEADGEDGSNVEMTADGEKLIERN
jgi:hypothetical protein